MKIKDRQVPDRDVLRRYVSFAGWLLTAVIAGLAIGLAGSLFHELLEYVGRTRAEHPYFIYFLPAGGLIIVWLYNICGLSDDKGTNGIIMGARGEERISLRTAPLIITATALTHLLGGSAGREGAALQLGGSLISPLSKPLKLKDDSYSMLIMCGMAAGFSALFGTPAAAAVFAIEVTVVGITKYSAIVPCLVSSLTAAMVANKIGVVPTAFSVRSVPQFDSGSAHTLILSIILGIAGAAVSIVFCVIMQKTAGMYKKTIPNPYARVFIGGVIVAAFSAVIFLITGAYDYNGAGTDVIRRAFSGDARPEAFFIKIVLTALTLGAGFKGGEIVPSLFVGSTFGCFFGGLIGLDPSFGAALGLAAVFCGVTNCPFASLLLSIELFGAEGLPYYALVIGISYMLSGFIGLYSAQKFYDFKLINGSGAPSAVMTYTEIRSGLSERKVEENGNN